MPGMIVLPRASICFAPAGIATLRPTAVIRFPSTTTVPLSIVSPEAVMMRAPVNAIAPSGMSVFAVKLMSTPLLSGGSTADPGAAAGDMKPNVRDRSRVKSSGPSDQCTLRLSPDQWMLKPTSRRDPRRRIALSRGTEIDRTARMRKRRDERVPALGERHPLAVGRRHDLGRVVATGSGRYRRHLRARSSDRRCRRSRGRCCRPSESLTKMRFPVTSNDGSVPPSRTSLGAADPSVGTT